MQQKNVLLFLLSLLILVVFSFFSRAHAQLGTEKVTITSPNGGGCYIPGSQITVTWTTEGSVDHIAIGYRTDTSTPPTWQQDFHAWDAHPVFGTSFLWTVPNITSSTVKLWIEGHNATHDKLTTDASDNTFTISDTCGTNQPLSTVGPKVTQVIVGSIAYQPTDAIQVPKGTNVTLVGTADSNQVVTIFVMSTEKQLSTTAAADGKWTFDVFTSTLTEGSHEIDLQTSTSPRAKALTFSVLPVGSTPAAPVTPSTPPASTTPPPSSPGSFQQTVSSFPYLPVGIAAVVALVAGIGTYLLVRKGGKRIDQTPAPPQIT